MHCKWFYFAYKLLGGEWCEKNLICASNLLCANCTLYCLPSDIVVDQKLSWTITSPDGSSKLPLCLVFEAPFDIPKFVMLTLFYQTYTIVEVSKNR